MKINKRPCHIIQVFTNSYEYDKVYKNYASRKKFVQWKKEIYAENGIEDKLIISKSCYENRIGTIDNLVVLIDNNFHTEDDYLNLMKLKHPDFQNEAWNQDDYQQQKKAQNKILFGSLGSKLRDVEIFKIRLHEAIELFINWDYWKVGAPKRESFKIAELKAGVPVNVMIDGKRDFSMTGRRKRMFIENNYILEYKGIFEDVEVMNVDKTFMKKVPENAREINLMKHLK